LKKRKQNVIVVDITIKVAETIHAQTQIRARATVRTCHKIRSQKNAKKFRLKKEAEKDAQKRAMVNDRSANMT